MKPHHTIETLQSILRDHVNYPDSICNHATGGNPLDREKTITSLIIDLSNRKLLAASGNPCEADYDLYELSA
jgi:isopenicillin-N N-acyltransferase-like protein